MQIARTLQLVGYPLFVAAGVLRVINFHPAGGWPWLGAYLAFGLAFHRGASVSDESVHRSRRAVALAGMVLAMLAMEGLRPCPYGALTLVIIASQAALLLSPGWAVALVVAQTAGVGLCLVRALGAVLGGAEIIALLGCQGFAVAAVQSARREAEVRKALGQTNQALRETRSLLEDATRGKERTRIARDLHDVLGHNLTALGLQLEIAAHVEPAAARVHTEKAREITAKLLEDVRSVVAEMRPEPPRALLAAIREILVEAPGLAIHLEAAETFVLDEPGRSECLVRCVQEVVTNTRRHAVGAQNLWIRLRREGETLVLEARDDGRGTATLEPGSGLRGMRSRLEELGGSLVVSAAEHAFSLRASLPFAGSLS